MDNLRKSLNNERLTLENNIKKNTPVRTGNLKRSVTSNLVNESNIEVYTLDYGKYVNYRTSFLTNAVSNSELSEMGDEIAEGMGKDLDKELEQIFNI